MVVLVSVFDERCGFNAASKYFIFDGQDKFIYVTEKGLMRRPSQT